MACIFTRCLVCFSNIGNVKLCEWLEWKNVFGVRGGKD